MKKGFLIVIIYLTLIKRKERNKKKMRIDCSDISSYSSKFFGHNVFYDSCKRGVIPTMQEEESLVTNDLSLRYVPIASIGIEMTRWSKTVIGSKYA